jgi:hypothetical protein
MLFHITWKASVIRVFEVDIDDSTCRIQFAWCMDNGVQAIAQQETHRPGCQQETQRPSCCTACALRGHCVHLPGNSPKIACHLFASTANGQRDNACTHCRESCGFVLLNSSGVVAGAECTSQNSFLVVLDMKMMHSCHILSTTPSTRLLLRAAAKMQHTYAAITWGSYEKDPN